MVDYHQLEQYVAQTVESSRFNHCDNESHRQFCIIVPIYNAFEHVRRCVHALLEHTSTHHDIMLCDDGSTDHSLKVWLDLISTQHQQISIIRSPVNRGYLKTVNQAMLKTKRDVVLLNSDTMVTAGWLDYMAACLNDERVAMVCPLSNNATILSCPEAAEMRESTRKRLAGQWSPIPVAVGSCLMIRRKVIESIGVFDVVYDPGYGEECDYSMRIRQAGHQIAVAVSAFVWHDGSKSFGLSANSLSALHQQIVDLRWPEYSSEILAFSRRNPLRLVKEIVRASGKLPRILHVLHGVTYPGGVELFTQDLLNRFDDSMQHTVLVPAELQSQYGDGEEDELTECIRLFRFRYDNSDVRTLIHGIAADIVHPRLDSFFYKVCDGWCLSGCAFSLSGWRGFTDLASYL